MSVSNSDALRERPDEAVAAAATEPAGGRGREPAPATGQKTEKELLCTICGLRACWEAPAETP